MIFLLYNTIRMTLRAPSKINRACVIMITSNMKALHINLHFKTHQLTTVNEDIALYTQVDE